jgi:peptide/nickel transport system permease protein
MSLAKFVLRRLLLLIPVLLGISILTFAISHLVPGDPARLAAGPQATPEMVEAIRQEFGLDKPLPLQYSDYIINLIRGNWGRSILSRRPVLEDLSRYWPATFELVVAAMLVASSVGAALGVLSAVRHDSWVDHLSRLAALLGVSIPAFWLAILVRFALGLKFNWFPISGRLDTSIPAPAHITGMYLFDSLVTGNWLAFTNAFIHIALPAITLSFAPMATVTRMTRATMLEVLAQDYIRTARAKGLSERAVLLRHALKNAFIPTITMMGLSFGWLMGGSVLVETIFDWPGIGLYAVNSALTLDFMPIMGIALLYGLIFSLINLLVDISYAFLDPRIRYT